MYMQKVTEAPSSVTIITADEIRRLGHRTLADVLRTVRGFYVTYDRNYSYLGVRGFSRPGDYNARVLLQVDGHRLNDNVFGSALIGTEFPLDVDLIERIEIIRGPSSALYGTSAFFAVINVITQTRQPREGTRGIGNARELRRATRVVPPTAGGSRRVRNCWFRRPAFTATVNSALFFPEFDDPATNNGIAERADSDQFTKLFARVSAGNLTLQALYGTRDKTIPTASFGTVFDDPRSRTIETLGFLDMQYTRKLRAQWELASRLSYDRYGYDGDYVYGSEDESAASRVDQQGLCAGEFVGGGGQGQPARRTDAEGGARRGVPQQLSAGSVQLRPRAILPVPRRSPGVPELGAVRAGRDHPPSEASAEPGRPPRPLRQLRRNDQPQAGADLLPRENRRRSRCSMAKRSARPTRTSCTGGRATSPKRTRACNPRRTRPGKSSSSTISIAGFRIAATSFYYHINDLITQQTDPADGLLVYNNIDEINARGVELEAEGKWPRGLQGRVSYTLQHSRE